MIKGSCHCGAVSYEYPATPDFAVSCNCSMCRRLGTIWIYDTADKVRIHALPDAFLTYVWGDGDIAFHSCRTCGTTTHYTSTDNPETGRIAVNLNLAELSEIKAVKLRHFDGADSFTFVD